jgi:hypothetical protein
VFRHLSAVRFCCRRSRYHGDMLLQQA